MNGGGSSSNNPSSKFTLINPEIEVKRSCRRKKVYTPTHHTRGKMINASCSKKFRVIFRYAIKMLFQIKCNAASRSLYRKTLPKNYVALRGCEIYTRTGVEVNTPTSYS